MLTSSFDKDLTTRLLRESFSELRSNNEKKNVEILPASSTHLNI